MLNISILTDINKIKTLDVAGALISPKIAWRYWKHSFDCQILFGLNLIKFINNYNTIIYEFYLY